MAREKTGKITRSMRIEPSVNQAAIAYAQKKGFDDFSTFAQQAIENAMQHNHEPQR